MLMRDKRATITQSVMMALVRHNVPQDAINEARALLEVELAKCEVYDRCTDVAVVDLGPLKSLSEFLKTKRIEGKSEGTIKRYQYEVGKLLLYFHKPLKDYTTDDLRVYLDYRKKNGKYKKTLSNRTLDGMRKCYSSFFKWLTAERIIEWNPCLALHQIKYKKTVRQTYSPVEMQKLREACNTIRDTALIDWLASTGCRVGEVETAKLSLIDWQERSIIVTGKGDKERKVYFNSVTAMHLEQYIASRKDHVDALFVGRCGNPLSTGGIQQSVKKIGQRAGVVKTHCHRFRHTLATFLATKMPVIEVATILGHEDISTTQIYCHADPVSVRANYRMAMA